MNLRGRTAGALAGLANGLFGGGGGMVYVPLMSRVIPERKLYATCVGVIFPVCALSGGCALARGEVSLREAAPYLAGGLAGGLLGGTLYEKIPTALLRGLFAAFLLWAGVRYLR